MSFPDLSLEYQLWKKGTLLVAGIDEVGRGCFAGPLYAGCVIFAPHTIFDVNAKLLINDSKKLSEKKRNIAFEWIKNHALGYAVGVVSAEEINNIGITKSTQTAFARSVQKLLDTYKIRPDHLLLDAFEISDTILSRYANLVTITQSPISKGDGKSFSIAAASIIAKVTRDQKMIELSKLSGCSHFDWHNNKGYGTKKHRQALLQYGPTKYHRLQFISKYVR